jgi:hypothetical protein
MSLRSALLLLLLSALMSCRNGGLLPRSGGQLYEVLLVGDTAGMVRRALSADVEGLPQPEPSFDVSEVSTKAFGNTLRYTRNIVIVDINAEAYTRPSIRSERNVWAQPQTVVHIGAPSATALHNSIDSVGRRLRQLLNRSEMKKQLSILRHERNINAEKLAQKMFGIEVWIPADMIASKRGKDFLWLSNNSATMMQNIVVYRDWSPVRVSGGKTADCVDSEARNFMGARDYMLGRNILGETDSMHMATVPESVLTDGRGFYRGLWMMTGDAMGGPFVSRTLPLQQPDRQCNLVCRHIVVEGFVFAPGKTKRNAVRRLEAVLYTMRQAKRTDH